MKVRKTIKFRLFPTHAQETLLRETLATCCDVYNAFLHWRRFDYELFVTSPSYLDQSKALPVWKERHPQLCRVYSQVLQDVCKRVDLAYQSYLDRLKDYQQRKLAGRLNEDEKCPGPPRYKGKGVYDSITYKQAAGFVVGENCISFSKLACVKAVIHRSVPGIAKTCTLRRHDFVHQASHRLVNRYELIAVEKLSVENMMATPAPRVEPETGKYLHNGARAKSGLNRSTADAAWSMFRTVLTYKAESAGRQVVNVNPAYTSQDCSGCGTRVPKTLKERWHTCPNPECGLSLHRDVNAAINILKRALSISVGLHRVAA